MTQPTTYYLIDAENTGKRWIEYIAPVPGSKVFLFAVNPVLNINYSEMAQIIKVCKDFTFMPCEAGVNAVDFQLISYLGFLLFTVPVGTQFVILSNDKGYDPAVHFWRKRGYNVSRIAVETKESPSEGKVKKVIFKKNVGDNRKYCIKVIENALPKKDKQLAPYLLPVIVEAGKDNLQGIYQMFIQTYGQKHGLELYRHIRKVVPVIQANLRD